MSGNTTADAGSNPWSVTFRSASKQSRRCETRRSGPHTSTAAVRATGLPGDLFGTQLVVPEVHEQLDGRYYSARPRYDSGNLRLERSLVGVSRATNWSGERTREPTSTGTQPVATQFADDAFVHSRSASRERLPPIQNWSSRDYDAGVTYG